MADDPEGDDPEGGDPEGGDPEGDEPGAGDDLDPDTGDEDPEGDIGVDDPDADSDGNGCTPGYWKQEQHLDSWTAPLVPETLFVDAFGVDAFPGLTLLDVLDLGEAELDALGRHAVAALLGSLAADVDYPLTDAEVIDLFTAAYDAGVYEDTKDLFMSYNEANCPLN